MDILAFYAQRVSMMIRRDNLSAVNCTSVSVTTSSTKMNFGFLPKFITIRCMVINFSARAEVHHRASLRSAIFSIPTQWTLALHTMGTEIVAALRIKRAIGIQPPTRIALFTLVKKSYAYLPKHLRTRMIGKLLS